MSLPFAGERPDARVGEHQSQPENIDNVTVSVVSLPA